MYESQPNRYFYGSKTTLFRTVFPIVHYGGGDIFHAQAIRDEAGCAQIEFPQLVGSGLRQRKSGPDSLNRLRKK